MVAVAVLAVIAGLAAWALRGDTPRAVDVERALDQNGDAEHDPPPPEDPEPEIDETDEPMVEEPPPADPDEPADADLAGTWTVDTSREFDREAGTGSFVGYRVSEELTGIGANVAVGRSPDVHGTVIIDGMTVVSADIEAGLAALVSDDGRRDNRVRNMLGPDATATFVLGPDIGLPEVPPLLEVVELETTGTLTILGVSQEVVVTIQAAVIEDGLLIAGSTDILLSDFGLEAPSAPIVLSVADEATLEWQLYLHRDEAPPAGG